MTDVSCIAVKFENVVPYQESKADDPLEEVTRYEEINQPVFRVADVTSTKVSDIFEDNGPVYRSKKACSLEHVAQFGAAVCPLRCFTPFCVSCFTSPGRCVFRVSWGEAVFRVSCFAHRGKVVFRVSCYPIHTHHATQEPYTLKSRRL